MYLFRQHTTPSENHTICKKHVLEKIGRHQRFENPIQKRVFVIERLRTFGRPLFVFSEMFKQRIENPRVLVKTVTKKKTKTVSARTDCKQALRKRRWSVVQRSKCLIIINITISITICKPKSDAFKSTLLHERVQPELSQRRLMVSALLKRFIDTHEHSGATCVSIPIVRLPTARSNPFARTKISYGNPHWETLTS